MSHIAISFLPLPKIGRLKGLYYNTWKMKFSARKV